MEQEKTKKIKIKEDADSGVENATDSCPSGDEDPINGDKKKNLQQSNNSDSQNKEQGTQTEYFSESEGITDVSESLTSCQCSFSEDGRSTRKDTNPEKDTNSQKEISFLKATTSQKETTPQKDTSPEKDTNSQKEISFLKATTSQKETTPQKDTSPEKDTNSLKETSFLKATTSQKETTPQKDTISQKDTTSQKETNIQKGTTSQKETNIQKGTTSQKETADVRIELLNNDLINQENREAIDFFQRLIIGQNETVDFSITPLTKKPRWLDEEKFKRGQKFARDYFFCINFAEMVSLFILFAQKSSLGPLIFTGKSDSPYTAFSRYLGTVTKLMSWYRDDLWGEGENLGKKNLSIVRGMHKSVYQKLTNTPEEELATKITLGNPSTTALWCPFRELLVTDFRENVKEPIDEIHQFLDSSKVWVNQADMSITQFGFVGLAVTYPEYFGIHLATEEDLDAFLHMWRGLGYLLGIKDEYNYCDGDLKTVRRRTKFFIETVAKPAFREVTCEWEHMCRCLISGIAFYLPQVNFESSLLYLCRVLDINTPRLSKNIGYGKYFMYHMHRLAFYMMKFPGVLEWLNCRLVEVIKKAQNASPEVLSKWRDKEFPYMKQEGKRPIRGQITSQNV